MYGACAEIIAPKEYNENFLAAIADFKKDSSSYVILGKGITFESQSIVVVENGVYLGFGYIPYDAAVSTLEEAKMYIKSYKDNKEVQGIISGYLKKNKDTIIRFKVAENERMLSFS